MEQTVEQHLKSRHLDMNLHHVWVSEELRCATFPVWNLSGQLVGYQRYRPDSMEKKTNDPREGRYFSRVKEGRVGVWGLESWHLSNTLFVTEGVFDAARLTKLGYSAVALFSYEVGKTTKQWLKLCRAQRPVVAVCDNDSSGLKLKKYGHEYHVTEDGDLGDSSEEYVRDLVSQYD